MRTKKSFKNIVVTITLLGIYTIIGFFERKYFIARLSMDYLGLHGVFENILSMLSLAELGFSTALMFALFKPIAECDEERIRVLLKYFRKIFRIIGAVIFIAGLAVIPFLRPLVFSKVGEPAIQGGSIVVYYVLFLASVSMTYLFSYKKILLNAYQDKYVASIITYSVYSLMRIATVIILWRTGSYSVYLMVLIAFNLLEGIIANAVSNRRYGYLKQKTNGDLTREDKSYISKNVRALFYHRLGGVVINGTDNLLISYFIGLTQVGIYANYLMVINAVNMFTGQVFSGILASVGDLGTTDDKKRYYEVFCVGLYVNALMFMTITTVMWFVFNDFIKVWFAGGGGELLLDSLTLALLLAVFLINGMRRISITFREAQGLYRHDRYKPIFESAINLIVSVVLAIKIGLPGVFIGTLASLLLTSFSVEPYVLYKYGFGVKLSAYFKKYAYYVLAGAAGFAVIYLLDSCLAWTITLWTFIAETALYMLVAIAVFILCTIKTQELTELKGIIIGIFAGKREKCRSITEKG